MNSRISQQQDIRDQMLVSVNGKIFSANIIAERTGVIAGTGRLQTALADLGMQITTLRADGAIVEAGAIIASLTGRAKQIMLVEKIAIGIMAKASGIATAARRAVKLAGPELRIVSGAWKKMPPEIKQLVRGAVACGGAAFRITDRPFLYLDKNMVRMLGGIEATLAEVAALDDRLKAIQLKGEYGPLSQEALAAVSGGAGIIMIDTGQVNDVAEVNRVLTEQQCRSKVQIAFAKGIQVEAIPDLKGKGIDILDIGVGIIDAPLLDMRLDVQERGSSICS